jgi:hypothetical protein
MHHCKTKNCTRNSVPEGFGYCSVCFSKIMEVRKVKALEKIANQLEFLNNKKLNMFEPNINENKFIKKSKINRSYETNDFIPNLDISNIKSTNITIETKTENQNLEEIKNKLEKI